MRAHVTAGWSVLRNDGVPVQGLSQHRRQIPHPLTIKSEANVGKVRDSYFFLFTAICVVIFILFMHTF